MTLLEENDALMSDVAYSPIRPSDLDRIQLDRLNRGYESVLDLCRLLLESSTLNLQTGRVAQFAFVFDMNRLFEEFVAEFLRRHKSRMKVVILVDRPGPLLALSLHCLSHREGMYQPEMHRMARGHTARSSPEKPLSQLLKVHHRQPKSRWRETYRSRLRIGFKVTCLYLRIATRPIPSLRFEMRRCPTNL